MEKLYDISPPITISEYKYDIEELKKELGDGMSVDHVNKKPMDADIPARILISGAGHKMHVKSAVLDDTLVVGDVTPRDLTLEIVESLLISRELEGVIDALSPSAKAKIPAETMKKYNDKKNLRSRKP